MLKVKSMLGSLSGFSPKIVSLYDENLQVTGVERINKKTIFREGVVYVGKESQMHGLVLNLKNNTLLLIRDDTSFSLPLEHESTILLFSEETSVERLMQRCSELFGERLALLGNAFDFFSCFLERMNLDEVVEKASRLIGNPIIIIDNSYKILTHSRYYQVQDQQWQHNIKRGYCSYEYIAGFNNIDGVRKSPDSNEPFVIDCFTSPIYRCISKLFHNGNQLGYMMAIESNSPFSEMDMQLYTMISDAVAKIVYMGRRDVFNNGSTAMDLLLIDCIEGGFQNRTAFADRMKGVDFDMESEYALLLVDLINYSNYDFNSEHLKQFISKVFVKPWSAGYRRDVISIIDLRKQKASIYTVLESNLDFFRQNNIIIAVSDIFADLYELPKHYAQASKTLHFSSRLNSDKLINKYDDFKFVNLVSSLERSEDVNDYCHSGLLAIMKYDAQNDTQYVQTLQSYIANDGKIEAVSKNIHVHKNTVPYRIRKIREIFGLQLDDPQLRFNLQYSFLLLKLANSGLLGNGQRFRS